jgi:hypothetical protein
MSTTIKKEVEIEIEYDDVCEAVSELSRDERMRLVQDCELLNDRTVIDYIDNLDSDEKQNIADRCELLSDDVIESHISNLSEEEVKVFLENAGHEDILNNSSDLSTEDKILLNLIKNRLTEKDLNVVLEKKDVPTLIKALIGIL